MERDVTLTQIWRGDVSNGDCHTLTMHVADVCGVGDVSFVVSGSVESKWRNVDFLAAASSGHELRFAIQFAGSLCVSVEIVQTRVCLTFRLSRVHLVLHK